jgi:hypothetical protein
VYRNQQRTSSIFSTQSNFGNDNSNPKPPEEEFFVDASTAAEFLHCSRKHVLKLSITRKIPAHPLPGSRQRRTWRFLLSELRTWMLNADFSGLGRNGVKVVPSPTGGSRKGGQ